MACAKCKSEEVVDGVRVIDRAESNIALDFTVLVERNPGALIFKGAESNSVEARVCGKCGYIELYASRPAALLKASKERKRR